MTSFLITCMLAVRGPMDLPWTFYNKEKCKEVARYFQTEIYKPYGPVTPKCWCYAKAPTPIRKPLKP